MYNGYAINTKTSNTNVHVITMTTNCKYQYNNTSSWLKSRFRSKGLHERFIITKTYHQWSDKWEKLAIRFRYSQMSVLELAISQMHT